MEITQASGYIGGIHLDVGLEYYKVIDFDKRALRRALVKGAGEIRKEARRLIARRAISGVGDFPGVDSGTLRRAIGVVSKGSKGGWIKVGVRKTAAMQVFYPAFLFYGSGSTGLKPRGNYITAALENRQATIRNDIRAALRDALVPR
jgi:hypothetical protein